MSATKLTEAYLTSLRQAGLSPQQRSDGSIVLSTGQGKFCLVFSDSDPEFVQILYPNFWSLDSAEEKRLASQAALAVSTSVKVAKVFCAQDSVYVSVELLLPNPSLLGPLLKRVQTIIHTATQAFTARMGLGLLSAIAN